MQLTLGRRWILELRLSVSLRQRMEAAGDSLRFSAQRRARERAGAIAWERDKLHAVMLSDWDRHLPR